MSAQLRNNQVLTVSGFFSGLCKIAALRLRFSWLQAISGNSIRINFYPSDLENIMTANCRKVSVRDVINDNSVVYFVDNVITKVNGSVFDYLSQKPKIFSTLVSGDRKLEHLL